MKCSFSLFQLKTPLILVSHPLLPFLNSILDSNIKIRPLRLHITFTGMYNNPRNNKVSHIGFDLIVVIILFPQFQQLNGLWRRLQCDLVDLDGVVGVRTDSDWELQERSVIREYANVEVVDNEVLYAVDGHVKHGIRDISDYGLGVYRHPGVLTINNELVTLLGGYNNIPIYRLTRQLIQLPLVYNHQTQIPLLRVTDHHYRILLIAVPYLQRNQTQMVVSHLYDYLLRPDLLVD